jgi:hypothetical protein
VTKKHLLLHKCFTCAFKKLKNIVCFVLKLYKDAVLRNENRHSHFIKKLLPAHFTFDLKFRANLLKDFDQSVFCGGRIHGAPI